MRLPISKGIKIILTLISLFSSILAFLIVDAEYEITKNVKTFVKQPKQYIKDSQEQKQKSLMENLNNSIEQKKKGHVKISWMKVFVVLMIILFALLIIILISRMKKVGTIPPPNGHYYGDLDE